ncbi:hypothetical protein N7456_004212 [Penicillium angulare]|uniref:Uncharacterized protein n=1 Tax=Penicillium angulare TaxID=116970 RepID=A0A9W9KJF7_9EURO|nr:hypothetical protein N7456_004212 [Penicillium angulare]
MAIDTTTQLPSCTASTNLDLSKTTSPQLALNRLVRHDLITTDFDELKFRAAAARQLGFDEGDQYTSAELDSRLIVSPYNTSPHLLDLNTLDTQSRLLTLALAYFKPITDDYATADYLDSFNWDEVFHLLRVFSKVEHHTWTTQTFYVVSFRSKLQAEVDNDYLHALDAHSHQEATASGGLLKYWFGTKNEKRENLATCIWRNRNDARLGGQGPWHAKARAAGRELYEHIVFSTMKLVVENDVASWRISEWVNE